MVIVLLSNGGAPLLEEEGRNGAGYPALVAEAVSAEDRRLRVRVVRGLEDQRRGGQPRRKLSTEQSVRATPRRRQQQQ